LQEFAPALEILRTNRVVEVTGDRIRLTEQGWLLADEIASYFQVEPAGQDSAAG
jgi:coproporphyrinogen III oxidase-like Fe-S oxidoreductase